MHACQLQEQFALVACLLACDSHFAESREQPWAKVLPAMLRPRVDSWVNASLWHLSIPSQEAESVRLRHIVDAWIIGVFRNRVHIRLIRVNHVPVLARTTLSLS